MNTTRENFVAGALCIGILLACAEGPSMWPQWAALAVLIGALGGLHSWRD